MAWNVLHFNTAKSKHTHTHIHTSVSISIGAKELNKSRESILTEHRHTSTKLGTSNKFIASAFFALKLLCLCTILLVYCLRWCELFISFCSSLFRSLFFVALFPVFYSLWLYILYNSTSYLNSQVSSVKVLCERVCVFSVSFCHFRF